jgi:hypothetical protein
VRGYTLSFFFLSLEGAIWLAHHKYFWNIGHPQHKSFPPQNRSMFCHASLWPPFYNLYAWKLNHGQTIWDTKKKVLNIGNVFASTLSTCEKHFGYLMEIAWEFVGNTLGTIFTNDLRIHSFQEREVIRSQEDTCISEHVDSHQPTPDTCV